MQHYCSEESMDSMEFSLEGLKTILVAVNNGLCFGKFDRIPVKKYFNSRICLKNANRGLALQHLSLEKVSFSNWRYLRIACLDPFFYRTFVSIAPYFCHPETNNISLGKMADYFPDFAYGLMVLSCMVIY